VAVKIKLQRLGKIRQPYYRIIVADARTRRDGKAIETIGKYHPKEDPSLIEVDSERAQYWLGVGAQPTEPVQRILEVTGDWQKHKGLPGSEGTLKVADPKPSKLERFNQALAEAGGAPEGEAAESKKRGGKKPAKAASLPAKQAKAEDKATKAEPKAEDKPAEKPAEAPEGEAGAQDAASESTGDGA
jgi:small subunit ribosomal protein S16